MNIMPELTLNKIITEEMIEFGLKNGIIEFKFTDCDCKITIGECSFIIEDSDFANLSKDKIHYFLFAIEIKLQLDSIKKIDEEKYLYLLNYFKNFCEGE